MLLHNTSYTSAATIHIYIYIYTHIHTHTHTQTHVSVYVHARTSMKNLKMQNKPGTRNNSGLLATIPLNIRSRANIMIANAISTNYYTPKHKLKILIS